MSDEQKEPEQKEYQAALKRHAEYEQALKARRQSPEFLIAPQELTKTVRDLERRGLLQYDAQTKHHDLHPVVRGVAAGRLLQEERELFGQRVVDHFSRQTHSPYEEAETLEDIRDGLHVVRTLLQMGRYKQACATYWGDLSNSMAFNLEAHSEILSLLRPFFPRSWDIRPAGLDGSSSRFLIIHTANALVFTGAYQEALSAYGSALASDLSRERWYGTQEILSNITISLFEQGKLAKAEYYGLHLLNLAEFTGSEDIQFIARLERFLQLYTFGRWAEAETTWRLLDSMGRNWPRSYYRPGQAEHNYAQCRFRQGDLSEHDLAHAERLAKEGKNRAIIRSLHQLRGEWKLEQGQWAPAADSFGEAIRMAREVGKNDVEAETQLALAKFHLGQLPNARDEAEQLAKSKGPAHRPLAELWLAIGDREQAKKHALAAYKWAWADGEPYVYRYELNKARALLERLGTEAPELPPYDAARDEKLPWEDEVKAAIEKFRAEKEAKEAGKKREGE